MAKKKQRVEVGERNLTLSNLQKTLYPGDDLVKAQVIEYYLNIAPTLLNHIKGRPLTLIRYPDGIDAEYFFQKDAPDWKPDWIDFVTLGESEKKDYMIADEPAALAWLANLASLEIHQMHLRRPDFNQPDNMVFDLDPADDSNFEKLIDLAFSLKNHVEEYGYHPFVKTSGRKGLHLFVPLAPEADMDAVFEAAKAVARAFVEGHPDKTTLQIKKKARKGRVLIDIYRNRSHQTIVCPYSLRATHGAPVSMPLRWEELPEIESSAAYYLQNAVEKVESDGDAWKGIGKYAVALHTRRNESKAEVKIPQGTKHKSPEELIEYSKKRNFDKTGEPGVEPAEGEGNRFVIQRHHATRLHYDLRLEREGVLKSWAVPKGLPPRPGIKRLAVETENHPLDYLTFEGEIPEDEYGGGKVWVYAQGRYEMIKEKKNSLHFRLESAELSGKYHIYHTGEDKWLLEKKEDEQIDWLNDNIEPMHAKRVESVPKNGYSYEVKWDGIRALVALDEGEIRIRTRNQNEVTDKFPELQGASDLRANCGLFDGEIVWLDKNGRPQFQKIINRLKRSAKRKKPGSLFCYLFDCLYLDGRPVVNEPLARRKTWVRDVVKKDGNYRFSESMEDGHGLLKAAKEHGMEGIMAKKADSEYQPGIRSDHWLKIKTQATADCYIIGYTKGSGSRSKYFGALHLADKNNGELQYRGKVGTGFDESSLKEIYETLQLLEEIKKPVENDVVAEKDTTWVKPQTVVEITYGRLTGYGIFREAVFQRLRPDLSE